MGDGLTLIEEGSGHGELLQGSAPLGPVRYHFRRFQGMSPSGLPIPGLHRIEGAIEFDGTRYDGPLGAPLTLRLEDGRTLNVTLADANGRILAVGHGPRHGCSCC